MFESMSRELRKLVRRRDAVKSSVNIISKFVEKFDNSIYSIKHIHTRLCKLSQCIDEFNEIQKDILDLDEGHEEDSDRLEFEDSTCTLKALMDDLIAKHESNDSENSIRASHSSLGETIKLPTIQPPTFNGNLEDWASFFDTFKALFHNNSALTDVQRLHYLKSSVSGPAADIIKNFTITSDNYSAAYEELVRHYENKGFAIQNHIQSLLQSPKVVNPSALELRKLHHHVSSHVRALKALGQPIQHWDAWLVTLICGQLDACTAGEWQLRQESKDLPTYEHIESFLTKRVFAFEAGSCVSNNISERQQRSKNAQTNSKVMLARTAEGKTHKCPLCFASHRIFSCDKFIKMTTSDRVNTVSRLKLCFNCLNFGHQVQACKFPSCPKCGKRHNSKLHTDYPISEAPTIETVNPQTSIAEQNVLNAAVIKPQTNSSLNVMLATAMIHVYDNLGYPRECRAVLDSGSQLNCITLECASKLGLQSSPSSLKIVGVGAMKSDSTRLSQTSISSRFGIYKQSIAFHSLPLIVKSLPSQTLDLNNLTIPEHIRSRLADPQFFTPGPVDVLIGSEIFFEVLRTERCPLSKHASFINTDFGWIVTGKLPVATYNLVSLSSSFIDESSLSLSTSKTSHRNSEEQKAEEHFTSTITRNSDGRYVVKLPLGEDSQVLGDSRAMAQKRFFNLEKRFIRDSALAEQYKAFMREYVDMDHMELAEIVNNVPTYYLPHHAVFKMDSSTTKVRVVFDGSAKTTSGISLNDILLRGPKVQADIFNILLRFRIHRIAITADVAKMYRQILVAPDDYNLQRIVYRENPHDSLKEYKLKTVTYGTKSASFLATRCLAHIASDINDICIKRIILQDFYVDDLISGGDSEEQLYGIYEQLQSILIKYGFPLRKWCSSSRRLMSSMLHAQNDPNFLVKINEEDTISALGLLWQPANDSFHFMVKDWHPPVRMTKRSLLSDINSIYDPIGLLTPVLIKGKIFIQQLWSVKLNWDELLPKDLQDRWITFYTSLRSIGELSIPRRVASDIQYGFEIHGFCDASQEAYGACIYIRSIANDGHIDISLYTSKSRVAPLRATTIPRLELCGALLLAELMNDVLQELERLNITCDTSNVHFWSDSTIVLAWISSDSLFQVYIANRIARIKDITRPSQWHHVSSPENPADLISRGIDSISISNSRMWWNGPHWLIQSKSDWPIKPTLPTELPEVRPVKLVLNINVYDPRWFLEKFSKWSTLVRVTAFVQRFVTNIKVSILKRSAERNVGFITIEELKAAETFWIADAQKHAFSDELIRLRAGKLVSRGSCLSSLSPFLDVQGLIRVGGRLTNAAIHYNSKHPVVLPSKEKITKLIFEFEHRRLLHLGPQALLSHVSVKFWPIRGRIMARKIVRNCLQCFRARPTFISPFMAPLPRERVSVGRPFSISGVDYCGPIMLRSGFRKISPIKGYICVFVCFATRAVHLELVSSLSTEDFLAALSRFIARRGQCTKLYSDNGTNFVGANRILKAQFKDYYKNEAVNAFLSIREIQWQFIPPAAPHFGGLWEAAVQAAKRHILRVAKGVLLTYEETATLLCRIEAALNSRPLIAMSSDPSELGVLTPGHFLIGGLLMQPPEPDIASVSLNKLRRYKLVQACMQSFWKRWANEYLPQVQKRSKWTKLTRNANVGDIAILKDDTLPPIQWSLVRVIQIHPGGDGIVRAVTLRNSSGTEFRRPVVKIALIPTEEDEVVSTLPVPTI